VTSDDSKWLLEIKSTRKFDHRWGFSGSNGVPPYYAAQCVWQMAVTGDERCDLAAFATMSDEYRSYNIYRDEAVESRIIEYVREWYDKHIKNGAPPDVDGSTACSKSLAKLFEQESKTFIEPSESHIDLAKQLKEIRRQCAELDEEKRTLENQLKEHGRRANQGLDSIVHHSSLTTQTSPRNTLFKANQHEHSDSTTQEINNGKRTTPSTSV